MKRNELFRWVLIVCFVGLISVGFILLADERKEMQRIIVKQENVISDSEKQIAAYQKSDKEQKIAIADLQEELTSLKDSYSSVSQSLEKMEADNKRLKHRKELLESRVSALREAAKKQSTEKQKIKEKNVSVQQPQKKPSASGRTISVKATAYTAYCKGCSGTTRTGINLRENPGMKVIAVDPTIIPLGSKVYVEGYGTAIAGDTGGAIKGRRIDIFMPSKSDALQWGIREIKVTVLS